MNGEQRVANGEGRVVSSEWRVVRKRMANGEWFGTRYSLFPIRYSRLATRFLIEDNYGFWWPGFLLP